MGERPWLGGDGGSDWGLLRVYAVPSGGGAVDEAAGLLRTSAASASMQSLLWKKESESVSHSVMSDSL